MGLAFQFPKGFRIPPSLKNIYQELAQDLGLQASDFSHGYLERWASQGVLLLNSVLTVRPVPRPRTAAKDGSNSPIRSSAVLGAREAPLVFMLWGSFCRR